MRTITISLLIILALVFSMGSVVLAKETKLPDPGLTPDSAFYFIEMVSERISTFFTFGDLKKAERHANLAIERLAEAQAVVGKGKTKFVEKTLARYEKQLENSIARAQKAQAKGKNIGKVLELLSKVGKATSVHLEVLAEVGEKVPEQAKSAIENAMTASLKGHEKAVEALKAKGALGAVPERVSLPTRVSTAVRERVQMKVQQELAIEKILEDFDSSKSLRELCIADGGATEMCEQFPAQNFKSFKQIEDWCTEQGGPSEICSTLESKCREVGVTEPDKCFIVLATATFKTYQANSPTFVPLEEVE